MKDLFKEFLLKKYYFEAIFLSILFAFSALIMFKTFKAPEGTLKIATKAWSDFAATIPLIRSFSLGNNFPPEYPIFPGPPIRYHFVFFFLVGLLERIGLRIDLALNTLSTIGFFLLALSIYFLTKEVFKKRVAALAVILFVFNGSLSFLEFFKSHALGANTIREIVSNVKFSSFGPYDGHLVSAFWNLNIFTNQRHLAISYAAFIFLILLVYKNAKDGFSKEGLLALGFFVGLFPFVHLAVFGMMLTALGIFFVIYPKIRRQIFFVGVLSLILAVPQFIYMGASQTTTSLFSPGYLIQKLTFVNFVNYWIFNLGLLVVLTPLGFILANPRQRKIIYPFLALFIIGNLFVFSPDRATNHKFFNLFLIGADMFAAFSLRTLWIRGVAGKILTCWLFFFLTLSGIIDFFPIINDSYVVISDYQKNPASQFILKNTPANSTILNHSFLYDPASLAGRKIYLGWPYFSWSAGYDTDKRFRTVKEILSGKDKNLVCKKLADEKIDFIEIKNPTELEEVIVNYSFFERNFNKIYFDNLQNLSIFEVSKSCNI